jgi:tripartite-type tricarboxylate transporter receptor subunit TctC
MKKLLCFFVAAGTLLFGPALRADDYPSKPLTLVAVFGPGSASDTICRLLAQPLSIALKQNVIVDNRPGANGALAANYVAHSPPDGYTLLMGTNSPLSAVPFINESVPYDPIKDFTPISEIVNAPNVLFVRPDSGINSIADLVARAKAEPNKLNYASPGVGTKSHLTGELLKLRAGINIQHIPYRGGGPATQALVSGTVQLGSVALAPVEPLIKAGTVRALAVTGATRWYSLPDVPTMIESGYPGFVSDTFNALFAPAGTPPEVVALLVKQVREAMKRPDAIEAARKFGYQIVAGTPDEMTKRLVAEIQGVKELVAKAGIKPEN